MSLNTKALAFRLGGGQSCCGATNKPCALPPGLVYERATGCEKCGHSKSCHAAWWREDW